MLVIQLYSIFTMELITMHLIYYIQGDFKKGKIF
jgi:hypothetical protein